MTTKSIILVFLIFTSFYSLFGQFSIAGKVTDEQGESIIGATVRLQNSQIGSVTNLDGNYSIKNVRKGIYKMEISMVGFETQILDYNASDEKHVKLNIILKEKVDVLNDVVVTGESVAEQKEKMPITVAAIDIGKLQAETTEATSLLSRVEGIVVRKTGGAGSDAKVSINGMSGNAVRAYYDGIPIEFLGPAFSINYLSINNIERLEVYKGVMPINVGTDALAGGINVVPKSYYQKDLSASFQIGSFSTYKGFLNFTQPINDKWFFNTHADYIYSKNDYKMDVDAKVYDDNGAISFENIRVKRFHDAFDLFTVKTIIGHHNFENGLSYSSTLVGNMGAKEYQHGLRVSDVPFGDTKRSLVGGNLINKLNLEKEKWNLNLSGAHGYNIINSRDTSSVFFDWYGVNITEKFPHIVRRGRAENSNDKTQSKVRDVTHFGRLNFEYKFFENTTASVNSMIGYQKQYGEDKFFRIGGEDPFKTPSTLFKNINAIEFNQKIWNERISLSLLGKHYHFSTKSADRLLTAAPEIQLKTSIQDFFGFGGALKFTILDGLFFRTSYEKAARIPDKTEIFGDLIAIKPNIYLNPERSNNLNFGTRFEKYDFLKLTLNYFIRDTYDQIILNVARIGRSSYINFNQTKSSGIEIGIGGNLLNDRFTYNYKLTYQKIRVNRVELGNEEYLGSQVPNIPSFFQNIQLTYTTPNIFKTNDKLKVTWFTNYIDEFPVVPEGKVRNDNNWVELQLVSNLGILYEFSNEKLSMNLSLNNIFDANAYDFISVPKPGFNYQFKIKYQFY